MRKTSEQAVFLNELSGGPGSPARSHVTATFSVLFEKKEFPTRAQHAAASVYLGRQLSPPSPPPPPHPLFQVASRTSSRW